MSDADFETEESYRSPSIRGRLRRASPIAVLLSAASFASVMALALSILSRSSPIGVLVGTGVVTGIIFALDTLAVAIATYRASSVGEVKRALLLAFLGGAASMISALSFAGALVLVLLLNP